jgi:AAA+ superfamily predicted ATPase
MRSPEVRTVVERCVESCELVRDRALAHREEILRLNSDSAGSRAFLAALDCEELAVTTARHLQHLTGDERDITEAILTAMRIVANRTVVNAEAVTNLDGERDAFAESCLTLIGDIDALAGRF